MHQEETHSQEGRWHSGLQTSLQKLLSEHQRNENLLQSWVLSSCPHERLCNGLWLPLEMHRAYPEAQLLGRLCRTSRPLLSISSLTSLEAPLPASKFSLSLLCAPLEESCRPSSRATPHQQVDAVHVTSSTSTTGRARNLGKVTTINGGTTGWHPQASLEELDEMPRQVRSSPTWMPASKEKGSHRKAGPFPASFI